MFFHSRFARRLLGAFLLLTLTLLAVLGFCLSRSFQQSALEREQENLINNAHIIELTLAEEMRTSPAQLPATVQAISAQTGLMARCSPTPPRRIRRCWTTTGSGPRCRRPCMRTTAWLCATAPHWIRI